MNPDVWIVSEEITVVYHENVEYDLYDAQFEEHGSRLYLAEEQLEGVQGHPSRYETAQA